MPPKLCRPCDHCGTDNPAYFEGAQKPYRADDKWLCFSCDRNWHEEMRRSAEESYWNNIEGREKARRKREQELMAGRPLHKNYASYRCVADPDDHFLGSYFSKSSMRFSVNCMPTGSLWLNDHTMEISEIKENGDETKDLIIIDDKRIKELEDRFPRLRRAICNPAVS